MITAEDLQYKFKGLSISKILELLAKENDNILNTVTARKTLVFAQYYKDEKTAKANIYPRICENKNFVKSDNEFEYIYINPTNDELKTEYIAPEDKILQSEISKSFELYRINNPE